VFLLTEAHWGPAQIGAVLTASGLIGILCHAPIGAFIDATHHKRALLVASVALLAACAITIAQWPIGPVVFAADATMAALGGVFAPAMGALSLGLFPRSQFAGRLARNTVFDRAGNIFIAALIGFVGWIISQRAIFYLLPLLALLAAAAVLAIPASAIDDRKARGFALRGEANHPEGWWDFFTKHPPLMILAGMLATFHLANAAMLPLIGQKLALAHPGDETVLVSACILVSLGATIPVALWMERRTNVLGRRPLLIVACSALCLKGMACAVFDSAPLLIAVQALDGMSSGILDILVPLLLADIVKGSGRYNVSRGLLGTIQGIGGSLSNLLGGLLVALVGYSLTFGALAGFAGVALGIVVFGIAETRRLWHRKKPGGQRLPLHIREVWLRSGTAPAGE
jgi:MFS family permease